MLFLTATTTMTTTTITTTTPTRPTRTTTNKKKLHTANSVVPLFSTLIQVLLARPKCSKSCNSAVAVAAVAVTVVGDLLRLQLLRLRLLPLRLLRLRFVAIWSTKGKTLDAPILGADAVLPLLKARQEGQLEEEDLINVLAIVVAVVAAIVAVVAAIAVVVTALLLLLLSLLLLLLLLLCLLSLLLAVVVLGDLAGITFCSCLHQSKSSLQAVSITFQ